MSEEVLLDWKESHADVYFKFKQDLEEQLLKPYHQNILDLGDGNAEPLQSVIVNLAAVSSKEGFDIDKLYAKAVESGDASVYCLCCYLLFDNGEGRLADTIADKVEKPDAQEILDAVQEYKRFYKQNRKQEVSKITADELNILTLRRWHYDHPEEYKEFTNTFQKAYDGDMTFIQTNFFFLMEMFSTKGVKGMMKIVASLFPGNKHYQQSLMGSDENPLKGRLSEMLDSSLNNKAIRERLLHKNPYLFSLYYWIIFDNGFLHAADLISQTFLKPESPYWEKLIGRRCVEALIGASIDKARYSKAQWKEVTQKLKKGEARQVIDVALLEVQGRRGRKSTYVLLEEMLSTEHVSILTDEIQKLLQDWKQLEDTDSILAYIFAALVKGNLLCGEYNYRTFHAAVQEKFPDFHINKGYDWAEALCNAVLSDDLNYNINISEDQVKRGRRYATDIKLRLLSLVNPNFV
ncbi:hypothetical protein HMPREF0647_06145 [Prevotella bivia DNF00320]|uniref:Uncharacterized protein n=1 Tax=Prevotella bivia DNF00320 TaxID=1401068 RepID=A0A096ABZ0_9BACT|nr:DUF6043 family protein [Prevotella bivia]KGF44623.1 hypothetical protein HMPREF0647_06145 [Prevotella bivia DNF00320]